MGPRERLLTAAAELMYERGYESVGVQALCERADVRKGSFYHWFASKQALAVAMLDASWERSRHHLFEPAFSPSRAPLARFDRFAELLFAHNRQVRTETGVMHGCRFGNFAAELSTRDPQLCAKVAGVFAEMRTYFAAAIADAVRAGDVAPVDVGDAALGLLAHMEGLLLVAKTANDPTPIRRFASDARALLGAGPATVPATDRTDSTRSTVR